MAETDTQERRRKRLPDAFDREHADDNVLEDVAQRLGFLDSIRAHPLVGWIYRAGVAVVGGLIILVGLVLIPAPGPGWLIVFAGLGVLSTEFAWAKRLLDFGRAKVGAWTKWIMAKPLWVRGLVGLAGACLLVALVLGTLYSSGWRGFPFD